MESINGEWWYGDGQLTFADGDSSDRNHEMIANEKLLSQLADFVDIDQYDNDAYSEEHGWDHNELLEQVKEKIESNGKSNDQFKLSMFNYIKNNHPDRKEYKTDDDLKDFIEVCTGTKIDPREFALKHWGWKRFKGNWAETYTLTSKDLKDIVNAYYEILNDEDEMYDEMINIEVRANKTVFNEVPLSVLKKQNPQELLQYREKYQ